MKKFALLLLCLGLPFLMAYAAVPSRITYQGRLSKSGVGAAGRHTIFVQFIDKDGNNLPAAQPFDVDVPASGDFSLDITNIPPDADWINGLPKMRVIVGGETLTPDQSFSATPYALVARNVENLDTSKVKLADADGALLSSWQSPDDPTRINVNAIKGDLKTTAIHGADHAITGKDPIPYGTLSPEQTHGTALVLKSTITQIIQPEANVVPLTIRSNPSVNKEVNLIEIHDYSDAPTERFHIKGSGTAYFNGNVGIGTDSPAQKLRVEGGNQVSLFGSQSGNHHNGTVLALETTGDSTINGPRLGFLKSNVKNWAIGIQPTAANNNFSIWEDGGTETPGTERFSIAPGGNVGIGTTTPGEALDVRGNVKLGNIRALTPTNWGYSTSYPVVLLGPTSGLGTVSIGYDPSGNPNSKFIGDGREVLFRNGTQFVTPNSANNAFHSNQIVLKDGNVGINKADPTKTLDVGGDANITGNIISASVGINNPSPTKALDVVGDANITGKITGATFGFGGMFVVIPLNPSSSRTNPFTGDFTCPAGFGAHSLGTFSDHSGRGAEITLCVK